MSSGLLTVTLIPYARRARPMVYLHIGYMRYEYIGYNGGYDASLKY